MLMAFIKNSKVPNKTNINNIHIKAVTVLHLHGPHSDRGRDVFLRTSFTFQPLIFPGVKIFTSAKKKCR